MPYYLMYDPTTGGLVSQTEGPDPTARASAQGLVVVDVGTKPDWRATMWDEATQTLVARPVKPPPPPSTRNMDQHSLFAAAGANWENLDAITQASILQLAIDTS